MDDGSEAKIVMTTRLHHFYTHQSSARRHGLQIHIGNRLFLEGRANFLSGAARDPDAGLRGDGIVSTFLFCVLEAEFQQPALEELRRVCLWRRLRHLLHRLLRPRTGPQAGPPQACPLSGSTG